MSLPPADASAEIDEIVIQAQPTPYVDEAGTMSQLGVCDGGWPA